MNTPRSRRTPLPAFAGIAATTLPAARDAGTPTTATADAEAIATTPALPTPAAGARPNVPARALDTAGRPFQLR